MEASLKLQAELLKKLKQSGYRVYDYRPKKAQYPFILIGDDRQSDLDVKNGDYTNVTSTMTVFSNYNGQKEAKEILEQIRQVCYLIDPPTYKVVGATVQEMFTVWDEENLLNQGVITVRFKLIKR